MNAPKTTAELQLELRLAVDQGDRLREANDRLCLKLKKCWEHSSRAARLSDPLVDFLTDDEGRVVHPGDQFDDGCSTEGLGLDDPDWDPEFKHEERLFDDDPEQGPDESYEKFWEEEEAALDRISAREHGDQRPATTPRPRWALTNTTKWPAGCTAFEVATGRECKVLETWPQEWSNPKERAQLNCYVEFIDVDFELDEDGWHSNAKVFTFDQLDFDRDVDKERVDPPKSEVNRTKWPAYCKARVIATGRECTVLETWPVDLAPEHGIRASLELASGLGYDHELSKEELNCYVEFTDIVHEVPGEDGSLDGVFTFDQLELLGDDKERVDPPKSEVNRTKWPALHEARVKATGRECVVLETWPVDSKPGVGIRAGLEIAATSCTGMWQHLAYERSTLNCYVEFSDIDYPLGDGKPVDGEFTLDQLEILGPDSPSSKMFEQGQDMSPDAKPKVDVYHQSPVCCPCCQSGVMLGHWLSGSWKVYNCECGAHWGISGSWSPTD